jgi:hypothetical protein
MSNNKRDLVKEAAARAKTLQVNEIKRISFKVIY